MRPAVPASVESLGDLADRRQQSLQAAPQADNNTRNAVDQPDEEQHRREDQVPAKLEGEEEEKMAEGINVDAQLDQHTSTSSLETISAAEQRDNDVAALQEMNQIVQAVQQSDQRDRKPENSSSLERDAEVIDLNHEADVEAVTHRDGQRGQGSSSRERLAQNNTESQQNMSKPEMDRKHNSQLKRSFNSKISAEHMRD